MKRCMIIVANVIAAPSSPLFRQNAERGGATRLKWKAGPGDASYIEERLVILALRKDVPTV